MPPARSSALILAAVLVAYAVGGMSSSVLLGNNFIASYALHPGMLVVVLGIPAVAIAAWIVRRLWDGRRLSSRPLTLAAFLLFAGTTAALLFGATRGWVAVASELLPKQPAALELKVLSLGRSESRRRVCHRHLQLQHGNTIERLCADTIPLRGQLAVGRSVKLIGAASPVGFHIRELQAPGRGA
jgi:hypothetical protein